MAGDYWRSDIHGIWAGVLRGWIMGQCAAPHPTYRKVACERLIRCLAGMLHTARGPRGYWIQWYDDSRATKMANDRKSLLLHALYLQEGRCFWCHYPIICVSVPHTHTILDQDPWQLTVLIDGKRVTLGFASADHVIPQWLGGQTTERNIVAACKACNEDRGQMHNRSWFITDVTGFEGWLQRQRKPRRVRLPLDNNYRVRRLGTSLRPLILQALAGDN